MPRKPLLKDYPQLKRLLQQNPLANSQFQSLVSEIRSPVSTSSMVAHLDGEIQNLRQQLEQEVALRKQVEVRCKQLEPFVVACGEILESQVSLAPYSQEVKLQKKQVIHFTPTQIRTALRLYWETLAGTLEQRILRVAKVEDPAAARNGSDE